MDEENTVLKSRLKSAHQVFRQLEATMKHLSHRLMIESSLPDSMSSLEEENTMMMIHGPAGAGSIPSEPSQATQDDFCADTQPDDGFGATEMEVEHAPNLSIVHEDEEETAPMTEGREGTEVVIDKRVEDQGERENEEEELIVVDKNDFQKEEVVEEEVTAGNLDETFQNTSAIMQSNEDTLLATPESSTQTTQKVESESPLSVNDAENGALTKEVQKNQIEDVVIVDNIDEEDKENTVKSVKVDKKNCTVPAISTTPTMRKRWLQVLNDDENNDEPSNASENGCIFDDETQLSEDVANILNTAS
jgi:hypothetical protein